MKVRYVNDTRHNEYIAKMGLSMMSNVTGKLRDSVDGTPFYSIPLNMENDSNPKLRAALLESIKTEGFRNPVLAYVCTDGLLLKFGNSRLQHAIHLDIPLPAIVCDHLGRYDDRPEVTMENYHEFFTDVPIRFEIKEKVVIHSYGISPFSEGYDPAGLAWLNENQRHLIDELSIDPIA